MMDIINTTANQSSAPHLYQKVCFNYQNKFNTYFAAQTTTSGFLHLDEKGDGEHAYLFT
jgi:hypothetical protein